MKFGLMFFAASDDSMGADKYRLVLESARFGDRAGFSSVWVAERHFTRFGGLYPNPAVLHAGLATATSRIRLQAGSVVAPLHHPLRIAEEWSVVDNLSNGRVGVSFASGWNPDDFIFFPERYADRHDRLFDTMRQVQRLWRGEPFEGTNGVGKPASVRIFPKPVQRELPMWVTVAGNPRTFERAGTSGAHLLTHLLDQDEATLASKIALYRQARKTAGFDPATGIVSLMVHTLVGADAHTVREQARTPYCNYIKANIGLFKGLEQSRGRDVDLSTISAADLDEFVNFLYDRFAATRGLIGTPASCAPLVSRLEAIGVNELACLLDFGPSDDLILANLPNLARLKDVYSGAMPSSVTTNASVAVFDPAQVIARCVSVAPGVWRRDGEALAKLSLAVVESGLHVEPASLEACSRVLAATLADFGGATAASYVTTGFDALDLEGTLAGPVFVHATATGAMDAAATSVTGDVHVYDKSHRLLARLAGLRLSRVDQRHVTDVDQLLYERIWRPMAGDAAATDATGRWLVIADSTGVAAELTRRIESQGGTCVTASDESLRGIVFLRGLDAASDPPDTDALREALQIAQSARTTPIWIVTRGAVTADATGVTHPSQSPLWGFGRALAVERAGALGGLVDLDPSASATAAAEQLLKVVLSGHRAARRGSAPVAEDMVAFRGGATYVPRLVRTAPVASNSTMLSFGDSETVLVTGGTGGLGLRLTEWLIAHGARHIVLCSRRAPTTSVAARLQQFRSSGVAVDVWPIDVADVDALKMRVTASSAAGRSITSVFHLAGVLDDGLLGTQTWERFAGVCAAKIRGAWNLHQLTRESALRHFVMFSSVSSILPAPGQSSYAAANAYLDGLAHYRRAQGLTALTVNWGPWSEAGHVETTYGRQAHAQLQALGIAPISPARGFHVLDALLRADRTHVSAVSVNWAQLCRADPAVARLGLLADVIPASGPAPVMRAPISSAVVDALAALPRDEQRPYLLQYLSDMVVAALKLRTDEPIDPKSPLFDVGLDSIMALELKDKLERAIGVSLSATLLFVHPTLETLCDFLLGEVAGSLPEAPASSPDSLTEDELTRRLLKEIEASRGA